MSKEVEIGTLVVVILKARNLIDKHSFYKQDVFAQASLNGTTKRTHVSAKGGQHPVWDAELRFPVMKVASDKTRKLEVACFAKEPRDDDLLGKGSIDILETLKAGEFDDWVSLDIDGVVRGELFLEMTYFPSAPPVVSNPPPTASLAVDTGQKSTRPPPKSTSQPSQNVSSRPIPVSQPSNSAAAQRPSRLASHPPPKDNDATMPPLPEDRASQTVLPGTLVPGGRAGPRPQRSPLGLGPLPSLLMPGNGNAPTATSRPQDYTPRPFTPPLPSSLRPAGQPSPYTINTSTQNPYISGHTHASPTPSVIPPDILPTIPSANYPSHASHHAPPTMPSAAEWGEYDKGTAATSFSFPMPMVSTPSFQPDLRGHDAYHSYGHHQAMGLPSSLLSDPRLQARYQGPLPFPPAADLKFSTSGRQPDPQPDSDRLEALKSAEEAAARRREQEQKDLELALKLDRELNP